MSEKSTSGTIPTPITRWETKHSAGTSVLLTTEYLNTDPMTGFVATQAISFSLTPEQCLDLADELTRAARAVVRTRRPGSLLQ